MISIIEDYKSTLWDNFIRSIDSSNIFHSWNWLNVLKEVYGYKIYLLLKEDDNKITAGFPFAIFRGKIISLPFSDYVPALYTNKEDLVELYKHLISFCKLNKHEIVIKDEVNNEEFIQINNNTIHFGSYKGLFTDCIKSFAYNHRWGVKKAYNNGLYVQNYFDKNGIDIYYKLHLKTRKRQGTPVQPYKFFVSILDNIIKNKMGLVSIVYKDEIPIAGGVLLFFNKTIIHKYGASDINYLKYQPNNILYYEMIKYAIENKYEIFDFGKTDNENMGLRKFKSGWGSKETPLVYSYFPTYKESKAKLFVQEKLLSKIILNSPEFVCKLIGESFYKYSN